MLEKKQDYRMASVYPLDDRMDEMSVLSLKDAVPPASVLGCLLFRFQCIENILQSSIHSDINKCMYNYPILQILHSHLEELRT